MSLNNTLYKTIKFQNGIPQGAILSPFLFKLFTSDLNTPTHPSTKLFTYADDITLISQHSNFNTATNHTQDYINLLQNWLSTNRMTASPDKSSVTLLTTDRHQSALHPIINLNDNSIPLNKKPKILGVTYDTHLTFSPHIEQITSATTRKMNTLHTLSQHNFSDRKHTLISSL